MIIDAHVYALPDRLQKVNADLPAGEKEIISSIYKHSEGEMALALSSIESIEKSMEAASISKSTLVSFPWRSAILCAENNHYIMEATKHKPDNFWGICSINPSCSDSFSLIKSFKANGIVGVKINPEWQGDFALDSECVCELADEIIENGLFLMTHVDHPFNISNASGAHLLSLARKKPELKIIAAHMGGMIGMYYLNENMKENFNNIWFDTAVSSTIKMVNHYIDIGLSDKIIFGTDFPFNHSHNQEQVVKAVKSLKLATEIESKIFSGNFLQLLKS